MHPACRHRGQQGATRVGLWGAPEASRAPGIWAPSRPSSRGSTPPTSSLRGPLAAPRKHAGGGLREAARIAKQAAVKGGGG